ncbi:unnamed protein product, partial [Closterium sp. NIES-54]
MARVWGCMVQYMVPQHQRGGKLAPKASWGLQLAFLLRAKVGRAGSRCKPPRHHCG